MLRFAEATQTVLHDDDGAIDDQAEVQRAETHQIARHSGAHHAGDGHQHGDRNDRRRDQRGADVPEQKEQHDDDQKGPFEQVLLDRVDGAIDQVGPVIDRHGPNSGGQRPGGLVKPGGDGLGDGAAVLADQHEYRAKHNLAAILRGGTRPQFLAHDEIGYVGDPDGHAVAVGDDDRPEVFEAFSLARDANEILFAIAFDVAGTDVGVVPVQGLHHLGHGHAVGDQTVRPRGDVILPLEAADGVHVGDARRVAQLRTDDPVLKRAQVLGRVEFAVRSARARFGLDREHEDFAEPGGDGTEFRRQTVGKLTPRGLKPFVDQLAREIDVSAVLEDDRHLTQSVAGDRAGVLQPRHACDGGLDREGDPLFRLQRREAGGLGVDLDLDVGDVGRGVDGQALETPDADCTGEDHERHDDPAEADRQRDDAFQHDDRCP